MATRPDFQDTLPSDSDADTSVPEHEFNQTDDLVERDRATRRLAAIGGPILVLFIGYLVGATFAGVFKLPMLLGNAAGLALGAIGAVWVASRSYVTNDAVAAFVTVDLLSKQLVTYGPGFHFSFPWEARSGANNVDLSEAAENGTFEVQASEGTGTLRGKYSVRLRPDIKNLPKFLAGVGSVASDLTGLINASILRYLSEKTVKEALADLPGLNAHLRSEFHTKVSKFERRFGVIVGDVTVSEILPSKEVQKAMDGSSESVALDGIVARTLGYPTIEAVHDAVKAEKLTSEQVSTAMENALAMTDNLGGMAVERKTYTVRLQGDTGLIEAAKAIVPLAPAIAGALGGGNQPRGNKPRKS